MRNHAFPAVLATEVADQAKTRAASTPAPDLSAVADQLEVAIGHLRRGELTAGTALADTALGRFRSLLGEPDAEFAAPTAESHVLDVTAADLTNRMRGLKARGVPFVLTAEHDVTGEVLSRLRYVPDGHVVDVTA